MTRWPPSLRILRMHSAPAFFFFFNATATTGIYTLSLHDALPISAGQYNRIDPAMTTPQLLINPAFPTFNYDVIDGDRKSTRLNSSHSSISYAVFCLKKKKNLFPANGSLLRDFIFLS